MCRHLTGTDATRPPNGFGEWPLAAGHWRMRACPSRFQPDAQGERIDFERRLRCASRRPAIPAQGGPAMSTIHAADRFTALPDDEALAATVVALEEHGFSVQVVDGLGAARAAVLARIPAGSSVMTNTSVTLAETGIADAINDGGPYESARNKMFALDFATQGPGNEGDRRPARLRPGQRPCGHPRRNPRHRLGVR